MKRLAGREERPRDEALAGLARDLPADDARELADLIEQEIGVPLGLLRAEDSLRELFAPLALRNPLTWLFAEAAIEDGTSEIGYRLRLRRQAQGWKPAGAIVTVRDVFVAWCRA